ncbi:hypothetical protein [Verrucomicrobium sp. BvORR106]|uniref:hypothetical protein n=1 Tax=Verrucomicrobium sp. BvORR106 TaxID=1403819 RepID=UPI000A7ADEA8|nr:hypothetical protein [Verrucomicrobium sp. BvORR106]
MITPDAFRPLPEKQVTSPWYGVARSLELVSRPFDAASTVLQFGLRLATMFRLRTNP